MSAGVALITGASSGIGFEFARIHARRGGDLILVARREERLLQIKADLENEHGITAHVVATDLSTDAGIIALVDSVKGLGIEVEVLINNAGFGGHGTFADQDLEHHQNMIDLNVRSLTTLTRWALPQMLKRGRGKILNVGSTAGMVPGPFQATYYATKAYVNSLSLALSEECRGTGVTVTCLAPGPIATEFFDVAKLHGIRGEKGGLASARDVAHIGYRAMEKGTLFTYNQLRLRFALDWLVPFLPRRMTLWVMRKFNEK